MADGGDVLYRPSKWGATFHASRVWELLGAGSKGPGKSLVLLWDPMPIIQVEHERCVNKRHPHRLHWGESAGWILHLRRTRPMLKQTIDRSKRFFPRVDPDAKWDEEQTTWTFKSGVKYQFGHCKDPDDYQVYESNEFTAVYFDELTQFLEEQYERIILCCRSSDPVLSSKDPDGRYNYMRIRAASNPLIRMGNEEDGGFVVKDPNWVRRRFVDPEPAGNVIFRRKIELGEGKHVYRERLYMPATIDDNPDPAFIELQKATLMDARPHIRKALLYGDWYVSPASHFADEWDQRLHVIKPFRIPPEWKRFRSMDWGFRVDGVVLWYAMDPEGNLYVTEELVFRKMVAATVAQRVKQIEKRMGLWHNKKSRITGPADRQIFREDGRGGRTIAETFAAAGIVWVPASQGSGSRYNNSVLVAERLAAHDNGTQQPGVVFFANCRRVIRTIPAIQTDPNDSEVPMEGGDDHAYDCCAYGIEFASRGLAGIPSMARIKDSDSDRLDELDEQEDREDRRRDLGGGRAAGSNPYLDD